MCHGISRQGAAMAGGRSSQQVNMAIDEITCVHQRDFHGGAFAPGFIVTADRIYGILTGSKDL